ncbi:hypothetical protein [Curtobacterium sp. MCSS17_005]|uniref:hypothetical protein n=1 Tax=Curtobacterium sp. MCSS17_005 TaxID=2175641 RepID=UPI0011B45256|nr:hypothetical protein [Curtobacterium sp. MCSS17_005]WIB31432.1 hypothetical protein DEJ20_10390 [Curtobacterium sp. MCSS17_005]
MLGLQTILSNSEVMHWGLPAILPRIAERQLAYAGPFFVSDDHGCAHGRCTHGAAAEGCLEGYLPDGMTKEDHRALVAERCRLGIERSDDIFFWFEDLKGFGSLVELGIAIGMSKSVHVYTKSLEELDELWFGQALIASTSVHRATDVHSAVQQFLFDVEAKPRELLAL